ncbi:MAG: prepilin-type N-terminal cleavage/methylation domain-containing protein [Candidatus Hydrogenedentes bacterium]|nr:prepilin-type N-terminal cleavage/methylation domain-containing protein [Candidatus Hydrogenedentota bacterium]
MTRRGFTLLEVLIAISILVVLVAVVYATFASVTDSMSVSRVRTEEMRLRQFLERSFRSNLSSVYVDGSYEQEAFQFIGLNDENTEGPRDSLRFVSTNALMGGMALPGDFKEVRYEVLGGEEGRLGEDFQIEDEPRLEEVDLMPDQAKLEATETPVMASNAQAVDETGNLDTSQDLTQNPEQTMYEAPSWSVPIRTLDFLYWDGQEWIEEWDSQSQGRLPWCVHVRINFARTDEEIQREREENIDIEENPDFECVISIPIAMGLQQDGRSRSQLEDAADDAEDAAENTDGAQDNSSGDDDEEKPNASGTNRQQPNPRGGLLGGNSRGSGRPFSGNRSQLGPSSGGRR